MGSLEASDPTSMPAGDPIFPDLIKISLLYGYP
jgi:hypothetical protein